MSLLFFSTVSIAHYKIINSDDINNENIKEHNEKWPHIPDHLYKILIIGGSGSGKTNVSFNLTSQQK